MAKRFADTDKYKKTFIRELPGAYKILWDYICLDCNHAGIWHADFQIAQIYVGRDMPITKDLALDYFNNGEERIKVISGGRKWIIIPFLEFQYGELDPKNRVHLSVLTLLDKEGFKPLASPLLGAMDKDMDKDMDKESSESFTEFWKEYPKKHGKLEASAVWSKKNPPLAKCLSALQWQKNSPQWAKVDSKGESGAYVPLAAKWIEQERWNDIQPGFDEVNCPECGNIGPIRKGFAGKLTCSKCGNVSNMGIGE